MRLFPRKMITASNLLHHYSYRPVLEDISFEIPAGELVAVMGPNGTGKSTILGLVAGTLFPLDGTIEIDGVRRRSSERAELEIRKKMAYLPDHPWLPSDATGHEFLASTAELYSIDPRRIIALCASWCLAGTALFPRVRGALPDSACGWLCGVCAST